MSINTKRRSLMKAFPAVAGVSLSLPFALPKAASAATAPDPGFQPRTYGTYEYPFAASSLWNVRPINPTLGEPCVKKSISNYRPQIAGGAYSTGAFLASADDLPETISGGGSTDDAFNFVSHPDVGGGRVVVIPRWPGNVLPATGADGHADIIDPVTRIIHSFWKLRKVDGRWTADMYAWSKIDGKGWGDAAHHYQGARAAAVPTLAGIIRAHEINDGDSVYRHALAMSLAHNSLGNGKDFPAYVYPATASDNDPQINSGVVPEGARLMLPANFDTTGITDPKMLKVIRTLQTYGAYVVDRNTATPFVIYVENGADFNIMPNGWDNAIVAQLDHIRAELRQVLTVENYIDGNGIGQRGLLYPPKMNLISMRGGWGRESKDTTAEVSYNSLNQQLEFSSTGTRSRYVNRSNTGLTKVYWALPKVGDVMKFTAGTSNGATIRLQVSSGGSVIFDSLDVTNGESSTFTWPGPSSIVMFAEGGGVNGMSTARAMLVVQ